MSRRLVKIAIELNVVSSTIVEFLQNNGFEIDNKPTSRVSDDMYEALREQFSGAIELKAQADNKILKDLFSKHKLKICAKDIPKDLTDRKRKIAKTIFEESIITKAIDSFKPIEGIGFNLEEKHTFIKRYVTSEFPLMVTPKCVITYFDGRTAWANEIQLENHNGEFRFKLEAKEDGKISHYKSVNKYANGFKYLIDNKIEILGVFKLITQFSKRDTADKFAYGKTNTDYKWYALKEYYPKSRFDENDLSLEQITTRGQLYAFKDGLNSSSVAEMIAAPLIGTFGKDALRTKTLVIIPASNSDKTRTRFSEFCCVLCERTGMQNGYSKIRNNSRVREAIHITSKRDFQLEDYVELSGEFQGKQFIVFDDVRTTGRSSDQIYYLLKNSGAEKIDFVYFAKTV